ncbi:MAG: hypothetical protein LBU46_06780 [Candidatus Accumulibacter sp.]|jgi:hypothetical protein|nr:hypothetical protein [Accumulibacter sp.]
MVKQARKSAGAAQKRASFPGEGGITAREEHCWRHDSYLPLLLAGWRNASQSHGRAHRELDHDPRESSARYFMVTEGCCDSRPVLPFSLSVRQVVMRLDVIFNSMKGQGK